MTQLTDHPQVRRLIQLALEEDLGTGDVTTEACVPAETTAEGTILARAQGVLAGLDVAAAVFRAVDPTLDWESLRRDGAPFGPGDRLATVTGSARGILAAERTALNFLQILSGIATKTAEYVAAVAPLPVRILDTRKTIPGWRLLSKYAVRIGGGQNHRGNLSDGILIKDNHIAAAGSVGAAVRRARERAPHTLRIQVEVESLAQLEEALEAGADAVLLDNMDRSTMRKAVQKAQGRALVEASGGIRKENLRAVAQTGVALISTSAITLGAPPIDIALELKP